jgi:hypothetical protein
MGKIGRAVTEINNRMSRVWSKKRGLDVKKERKNDGRRTSAGSGQQ